MYNVHTHCTYSSIALIRDLYYIIYIIKYCICLLIESYTITMHIYIYHHRLPISEFAVIYWIVLHYLIIIIYNL